MHVAIILLKDEAISYLVVSNRHGTVLKKVLINSQKSFTKIIPEKKHSAEHDASAPTLAVVSI